MDISKRMSYLISFTDDQYINLSSRDKIIEPDEIVIIDRTIIIFIQSTDSSLPMNSYVYRTETPLSKSKLFDIIKELIIKSYIHHNSQLWESLEFRRLIIEGIFNQTENHSAPSFLSIYDFSKLGLKSCRYIPEEKILVVSQIIF